MTKKQKAIQIIEKICKSKDFGEISKLRSELEDTLDRVEEDKVRAWLKKDAKKNGEIQGTAMTFIGGRLKSVW